MVDAATASAIWEKANATGRSIAEIARENGFEPHDAHNAIAALRRKQAEQESFVGGAMAEAASEYKIVAMPVKKKGGKGWPAGKPRGKRTVVASGGNVPVSATTGHSISCDKSKLIAEILTAFAKKASANGRELSYTDAITATLEAVEKSVIAKH